MMKYQWINGKSTAFHEVLVFANKSIYQWHIMYDMKKLVHGYCKEIAYNIWNNWDFIPLDIVIEYVKFYDKPCTGFYFAKEKNILFFEVSAKNTTNLAKAFVEFAKRCKYAIVTIIN